jgi:hypothetical protein
MPDDLLHCEQAIFTSIRTPIGEGYRIVSSSRGMRPEEKQAITRMCPSHDALCANEAETESDVAGVSYFPLPRGRVCVSVSRFAGAEHTGRGGKRVYSLNVVFEADQLARVRFNPFDVVRSIVASGAADPQLKPPPVLPELDIPVAEASQGTQLPVRQENGLEPVSRAWRMYALHHLLEGDNIVLIVPKNWLMAAETMLMGVPGPMRTELSFSAGIKYSVGRSHRLAVTQDDPRAIRSRPTSRAVEFIDAASAPEPQALRGEWLAFVERHWSQGSVRLLDERTSRGFANCGGTAREWLAGVFNTIDNADQADTHDLLAQFDDNSSLSDANQSAGQVERELAIAVRDHARQTLLARFDQGGWPVVQGCWHELCERWCKSDAGGAELQSLIEKGLAVAKCMHPAIAAEAALHIAEPSGRSDVHDRQVALVTPVLAAFRDWANSADDSSLGRLPGHFKTYAALVSRWNEYRGRYPAVDGLQTRLATSSSIP